MADRYTYLPSIGLFWLIVWGIADLISRISVGLKSLSFLQVKSYVPWCGSVVLLFCLAATARQLSYWQNPEKLLRRTISVTRNNYVAYDYLGTVLHDKGKVVEAKTCFETSIKICPRFPQAQYNYGTLLLEQGDADAAIPPLRKALTLDSKNANAHQNLAMHWPSLGTGPRHWNIFVGHWP